MKTITLVAYKRPHYLNEMLTSLKKNDLHGWKIYIQLDPSPETEKMVDIIKGHLYNDIYEIKRNATLLGVRNNPYNLIDRVFSQGSEINIHLEEDILVGSDVIALAEWYRTQNLESILSMNLVATGCFSAGAIISENPNDANILIKTHLFNSIGVMTTKKQWDTHFKNTWLKKPANFCNYQGISSDGWDISLYHYLLTHENLFTLAPLSPRAKHIGTDHGTFCTHYFQEKAWSHISLHNHETNRSYHIKEISDMKNSPFHSQLNLWEETHMCLRTIKNFYSIGKYIILPLRRIKRYITSIKRIFW